MQGRLFQCIFGNEDRLSSLRVLMIGVGGIGCEVLKMVSNLHFQELHIIDMDTIEVSNLNRQFLFRKEHRGQPKSQVAAETMRWMAPQLKVVAHVAAVGVGEYRMAFIGTFDVVIMALDNQETRSYVNKVCRALGIYLLDAGSMGFRGQSNQYFAHQSLYCYDCFPLASGQKQYPACTIRQQPSNCVHCVIWSKYLFTQLFTAGDEESGILEMKHLDKGDARDLFDRIFNQDIRLIKKELVYHCIDELPLLPLPPRSRVQVEGCKKFELAQLVSMWFWSYRALHQQSGLLTFEKDDWVQTLFIYSSTCLRCMNFSIEPLDYQQVKTICGNIVHAIASTNSLVSALEISKMLAALHVPYNSFHEPRGPSYVSTGKRERIVTIKQQKRNPSCNSCFTHQLVLHVDFAQTTFGSVVTALRKTHDGVLSITEKNRILWDDDDEDLLEAIPKKPLGALLDVERDNRLLVTIDDQVVVVLWVIHVQEEVMLNFELTSQLHQRLKLLPILKDLEVSRPQRESKPMVENVPVAKLISLSDSEDEGLGKKPNHQVISID